MSPMYLTAALSLVALASASGWAGYDDGSWKGNGLVHSGWAGDHGGVNKYGPAPLAHDGRVIETPEVAHARAAHLAAHAKAAAAAPAHGAWNPAWDDHHDSWAPAAHSSWAPAAHSSWAPASHDAWAPKWNGPLAHIELTHDGKYVKDTPEVAHARAEHLAAVAAAQHGSSHHGYGPAYGHGHGGW